MIEALTASNRTQPPPYVAGFERIQRYWDRGTEHWAAKILPGEYFVTTEDEVVTTVLGSCVSACIRDTTLGCGGMNHFMLPEDQSVNGHAWTTGINSLATRFGSYAMESLINEIMKLGARRERLEVKVVGGGKIMAGMMDVGAKNIEFVREYLRTEGMPIAGEDLGDIYPRRVIYSPRTGKVLVKKLRALDAHAVATSEARYRKGLIDAPAGSGDVELFT